MSQHGLLIDLLAIRADELNNEKLLLSYFYGKTILFIVVGYDAMQLIPKILAPSWPQQRERPVEVE